MFGVSNPDLPPGSPERKPLDHEGLVIKLVNFYNLYIKHELFPILSPSLFPFPHGGNSFKLFLCFLHIQKLHIEQRNHPYSILDTLRKFDSLAYQVLNNTLHQLQLNFSASVTCVFACALNDPLHTHKKQYLNPLYEVQFQTLCKVA